MGVDRGPIGRNGVMAGFLTPDQGVVKGGGSGGCWVLLGLGAATG